MTVLIGVYVKKYGLWARSFKVHIKINSPDFNKPEKIAEKLTTLRDILCPCSESFINAYYNLTETEVARLFIARHHTKDKIYKNFKNKKMYRYNKEALMQLYYSNIITIKFL